MSAEWAELNDRLDDLERGNRRLKGLLLAVAVVAFGCGASTNVANYGTVRSHTIGVFADGEKGEVVVLDREAKGGRIVIKDATGKARVRIDVDGVHTL